MKKIILLAPLVILLAACGATSGGTKGPFHVACHIQPKGVAVVAITNAIGRNVKLKSFRLALTLHNGKALKPQPVIFRRTHTLEPNVIHTFHEDVNARTYSCMPYHLRPSP